MSSKFDKKCPYQVVLFTATDEVEFVPTSWFVHSKSSGQSYALWPPYQGSRIVKAQNTSENPDPAKWSKFPVRLKYSAKTLKEAQRLSNLGCNKSDLSTSTPSKKRKNGPPPFPDCDLRKTGTSTARVSLSSACFSTARASHTSTASSTARASQASTASSTARASHTSTASSIARTRASQASAGLSTVKSSHRFLNSPLLSKAAATSPNVIQPGLTADRSGTAAEKSASHLPPVTRRLVEVSPPRARDIPARSSPDPALQDYDEDNDSNRDEDEDDLNNSTDSQLQLDLSFQPSHAETHTQGELHMPDSTRTPATAADDETKGMLRRILEILEEKKEAEAMEEDMWNSLPVGTWEGFQELEAKCTTSKPFRLKLVRYLSSTGGLSCDHVTRAVMSSLMSSIMAHEKLNWDGQPRFNKTGFKKTTLRCIVSSAVRRHMCLQDFNIHNCETAMKSWLKYAGDRRGGSSQRKKAAAARKAQTEPLAQPLGNEDDPGNGVEAVRQGENGALNENEVDGQ